ncbi:hypothetical protein BX600DRAFT_538784 [Xylariales sp. PMI_506]|nr:hypothetical protein BX600DRAFT_538784 [Xylariales sp. PMI_506]
MSDTDGVITVIPAPDGYVVNFANPTRNWTLINQTYWIYGSGTILALFFLAQNIFVKLFINRKFDLETGCLVASWAFSVVVQALLISTVAGGLTGTHAWEISLTQYNYWSLIFYVSSTLYTPTTGFAKLSLLCFYSKLSPARWWIWCTRVSLFILAGYSIAITLAMLFACNPIKRSWDVTVTEGSCINRADLYIAIAALQILTDIGLIVMPIPMIYGLQMRVRQKIGLLLMFVIGSSTLVTSVMRLVTLIPSLTALDQTWALSEPVLWICVEGNLLTICASFPTLRRFFRLVAPSWIGESEKKSSNNHALNPLGPSSGGSHPFRTFGAAGSTPRRNKELDTLGLTRLNDSDEDQATKIGRGSSDDTDGDKYPPEEEELNLGGIPGGGRTRVEVRGGRGGRGERRGTGEKARQPTNRERSMSLRRGVQPKKSVDLGGTTDREDGSSGSIASSTEVPAGSTGGGSANRTWDPRPAGGETEAERAIVQTKSYVVTRQPRTGW